MGLPGSRTEVREETPGILEARGRLLRGNLLLAKEAWVEQKEETPAEESRAAGARGLGAVFRVPPTQQTSIPSFFLPSRPQTWQDPGTRRINIVVIITS